MKLLNKYIILLFVLIMGIYACKKDNGNYKYTTVDTPTADSSSLAPSYSVEQYDTLTVTPQINYKGNLSNLSYQWLTYVVSTSSPTIGPANVLATTKNINMTVTLPPGNYYLELIITDKSNNLKTTTRTLLNVAATIETGWLVLHTLNNQSDVDFIASTNLSPTGVNKRLSNLFQTIVGSKVPGDGQMIGYSRRSNSVFNWITVGTDEHVERVNGFTFALMGADNSLFRNPLKSENFQAHINNGSNEFLIVNGLLQACVWGKAAADALYNAPFNGDYSLAPYIVYNDFSNYGALVYDQKYQHFLYTTQVFNDLNFATFQPSANNTQAFDPSNVGKTMLFMDRGYKKNAYAFFKDNSGNGRYLYILDQNDPDNGTLALGGYDMSALTDILNAQFFQVGDLGPVALYATTQNVYRFDYLGTKQATLNFTVPTGETITSMKIFKPELNPNAPSAEFTITNNAIIYIATWDGTQGKLYELAMNPASGIINPTPLKIYTGFGKIKDMIAKFRGTGT